MKNLLFTNEAKKRVCFNPNFIGELKTYFEENDDATLIIDFDELFEFRDNPDLFVDIVDIDFRKLLLIGNGGYRYNLQPIFSGKKIIELDDKYSEFNYDFSEFGHLKILRYEFRKGSSNLNSLKDLKELSLWNYSNKDLKEFLDLFQLEEMRFIQSNLQNISDIHQFELLKKVFLVANKKLSLDSEEKPNRSVQELYIDDCKKIDLKHIPKIFPDLKKISLINNGEIPNLKVLLDYLPKLENLNLTGVKLLKSINSYKKKYPKLKIEYS